MELLFTTTSAVGKQVSELRPKPAEVDRWADAIAEMLNTYLEKLAPRTRRSA